MTDGTVYLTELEVKILSIFIDEKILTNKQIADALKALIAKLKK